MDARFSKGNPTTQRSGISREWGFIYCGHLSREVVGFSGIIQPNTFSLANDDRLLPDLVTSGAHSAGFTSDVDLENEKLHTSLALPDLASRLPR